MIISKNSTCLIIRNKEEKGEKTMKKRTIAKTGATMLTMAMLLNGTTVFAADNSYQGVKGGSTAFDKYLVMDQEANVPNASFTYTIAPGTAKNYDVDNKKVEVLAGVGTPTMTDEDPTTDGYQLVFKPTDTLNKTLQAGDQVKDFDVSKQGYAKKTSTVDFSEVTFTEPGIYRYVITEAGRNQAVTNDTNDKRYLDVYVIDERGVLKVSGYILHATDSEVGMGESQGSDGTQTDNKSQGFTNTYDTSNLTFKKEVSGNQASHDKYFEFTVEIKNAVPETVYNVDIQGATPTSGSNAATIEANVNKANVTKLTVDTDGKVTQKFYLQHGQYITIQGIAKDTKYDVTENKEDYKSEAAAVENYKDPTTGTVASTDLKTSYLNTRAGSIPTGVIMTVAPFAAVTLLGAAGMVTIKMRKKEDDVE